MFNPVFSAINNLFSLSDAKTRSISPENPTGEKGKGGMCPPENGVARYASEYLGIGWKTNPYIVLKGGSTAVLADISGPGCIQHIWITPTGKTRSLILRVYWDNQSNPSVECPLGDFFGIGWEQYSVFSSLAVCVNPANGMNSYWQMPFHKHCRIELENRSANENADIYFQINYCLCSLPIDIGYFHAQFRRMNPVPYQEPYILLDGVSGKGHYVGTILHCQTNSRGWWGEGEFKFYLDNDKTFPTICSTGLEDYFGGSYDFKNPVTNQYAPFSSPYSGLHLVSHPDGLYESQQRFSMYRWHILDPIRFEENIHVNVQALGWRGLDSSIPRHYLPLQDDYASVTFWYQTLPHKPFPQLMSEEYLEVH